MYVQSYIKGLRESWCFRVVISCLDLHIHSHIHLVLFTQSYEQGEQTREVKISGVSGCESLRNPTNTQNQLKELTF